MAARHWFRQTILERLVSVMLSAILFAVLTSCSSSNSEVSENSLSDPTSISTQQNGVAPTSTIIAPTQALSPTEAIEPSPQPSATSTNEPTRTSTPTLAPTPTETPLPTASATYSILRGTILEQANCRYGPGAAYLYKYGVYPGFYMDIIGRNETGNWVVVQAIGGTNPCWVKASLINIEGNVMSVAPTWLPLPESPYYGPLSGVSAIRQGESVILSWNPLMLRAGDDSLQYPYLVEAWLCTDGQLSFTPIGSWETMLTVKDEAGCAEPSHARVYGVEKHGYTAWVNIPWPTP